MSQKITIGSIILNLLLIEALTLMYIDSRAGRQDLTHYPYTVGETVRVYSPEGKKLFKATVKAMNYQYITVCRLQHSLITEKSHPYQCVVISTDNFLIIPVFTADGLQGGSDAK